MEENTSLIITKIEEKDFKLILRNKDDPMESKLSKDFLIELSYSRHKSLINHLAHVI